MGNSPILQEESTIEKEQIVEQETKETIEDKELQHKKNINLKLYPIYRIFSWDLFFYYAIIYLFLTIEKHMSPAEILLLDAFYIFFKFLTQIPATILIQKIGKRKSLIIANFIAAIHILFIIFAKDYTMILISQLLCAFAYIIKSTCESDMLYDSIEHGEKRGAIFAKIDGKANAIYYFLNAISSILSGFLFIINPYIPMVICFIILLIVFFTSTKFEDIHEKRPKIKVFEELKSIKHSFKNIFKSKRLKSLLIFNGVFIAIMKIFQTISNTVLIEIGMPEQYFGIIFAIMGIVSGIAAREQGKFHKKFKNRTLSVLAIPTVLGCLILGFLLCTNLKFEIMVPIILVIYAIQYIMKGPYYVLIKQYFNNFTNSEKRIKISTANNIAESLISSLLVLGASCILENVSIQYTLIIIGCIEIITVVLLLDNMRKTVGLKMEQYGKKELL